MKPFFKLISLFVAVTMLAAVLTGCTSNELTLFNAMLDTQSIKTMESKTEISMKMEVSGLSEHDQESLGSMLPLLNSSKMVLNQKLSANEDKTSAKTQTNANVSFGGMSMDMGVWVDYDFTGSKPELKEIIKLPLIATMGMPEEYKNKEYMVLDLAQMPEMDNGTMTGLKQMVDMNRIFNKEFTEFFKKYAVQLKPGFEVVKLKENRMIAGQSLPVYELRLNDQTFKALLRYTTNNFVENKDAVNLIKKYLTSVSTLPGITNKGDKAAEADLQQMLSAMDTGMPKFKEQFNKVMDALNDVKIIGDQGMVIDYAINKDGYIVSQTGTIDIEINKSAIEQAMKKLNPDSHYPVDSVASNETYKLTFNFDTAITNINKAVDIQLPELNDKNSFNMSDMQKSTKPVYK